MRPNLLNDADFVILRELNRSPVELGSVPRNTADRLISMGLARVVLGTFEITPAGQLTCQRDRYRAAGQRGWSGQRLRAKLKKFGRRQEDIYRSDNHES